MMNRSHRAVRVAVLCALVWAGCGDDGEEIVGGQARPQAEAFIQGAPFHGLNGMNFDSEGNLYMASVKGREIIKMDPETGEVLQTLGPADGVDTPDDLTFGPDGSLYWTSLETGFVGRRKPSGEVTTQFVGLGVNPITFSASGRLFVALDFYGDGLYELDPELVEPPALIIPRLGWLNGFDFGPDGLLYGPIITLSKLVRIDVDTPSMEDLPVPVSITTAAKFDSQGRLVVTESQIGQVSRIDISTWEKEVLVSGMNMGQDNLALDPQDRLYVSRFSDSSVIEVLNDGSLRTVSPEGISYVGGLAVLTPPGGAESLFLADQWTVRQYEISTGELVEVVFSNPFDPTAPINANAVSADGDKLILTTYMGFVPEIQIWDPVASGPERLLAYSPPFVRLPLNAIAFQGRLAVAETFLDLSGGQVISVSKDELSDQTVLAAGLGVPVGMVAIADDLYVADWSAGTVLRIVSDGQPLAVPDVIADGLAQPEGLTAEDDGALLVVETGTGSLLRIEIAGGDVSTVIDGLGLGFEAVPGPGHPPIWFFNDVAVGSDGAIFVSGDVQNVIYRIDDR
ncbi:MAG: hypothetical protein AB1558_03060 [Thermodesulfobacteriota bacterium]